VAELEMALRLAGHRAQSPGVTPPRRKQAAACFLVELGNGDKFVFDMGAGSAERLLSLGIPIDKLDKIFIGHLHLDHAGDFPTFYFTGPVNNRLSTLRLWGPNGVKPEWGTRAWVQKMKEMWAWEEATRSAVVDPRGMQLEVHEVDWTRINQVIYDKNGVQVRSIPAIHGDQSMSFILKWKGLQFAFSSDTLPNKWWVAHTKGVDLAVHECFFPPDLMVWNVTKRELRTRMAVVNHESYPAPPLKAKKPPDSLKSLPLTELTLSGVDPESARQSTN
jgi:ribonuclease Z